MSFVVKSSCQASGIQTNFNACLDLSEKLQGIWGLPSEQKFGRNLISKLFVVCSADIDVLFGFIKMSSPSKTREPLAVKSSDNMALQTSIHPFHSAEAAKISRFYSALTKVLLNPIVSYGCLNMIGLVPCSIIFSANEV